MIQAGRDGARIVRGPPVETVGVSRVAGDVSLRKACTHTKCAHASSPSMSLLFLLHCSTNEVPPAVKLKSDKHHIIIE